MRRTRIAIIGIALVLVCVVVALPFIIDVNRYREPLQSALEARLGRDVTLGPMRLSVLPPGLRVADTAIGDDAAFQTVRPFVQVEELYVSPRLWPLLRGEFELRTVELRRPAIELVRNADGAWNFASLGSGDARESSAADGDTAAFVLQRLVVTGGLVAVTDRQTRPGSDGARSVYENIDVELEDYAPDRAFGLVLAATLPGEGAQRLRVRGTAGPVVPDAVATTPFDGEVTLDAVSISGAQRFLQLEALEGTDAVVSGRADVRNRDGVVSAAGSLRLAGVRARGVEIDYPIEAAFDLTHDSGTERLTIETGTVRLDRTPLSVTGAVDLQPETPVLDLHVTAADASLAEAARLASAFGVAFGSGTDVQGQWHADLRARGPATRPALDGQIRLRDVRISGADIPQPVRTDAVDVALTPQEIRTNDFTASTGGTSVGVRATVGQYTAATPVIDARIHTTDADLGEVLDVARAWGVAAVEGTSGRGRLTLDVRATGPTSDLTLSGSGRLRDAAVTTAALTQPLRIGRADLTFNRNAAVLQNLAASIGSTNAEGNLSVRDFAFPQVEFQLTADTVNVKELQDLMAPSGTSQAQAPAGAADGDPVLRRTSGSGRVRIGTVTYDQLVLEDVQATASLDRGLIRLDPITAGLYGGHHRGAIVMDARQTPPMVSVSSELEQVDANRLASATTSLRDIIFGALGSRVRLDFAADDAASLAPSLNGTLSLHLAEGRIANMNLTQEVANIARFVTGQERAERTTQVAGLTGTLAVTDGVARTDDLQASIEGGTIGATGTINLVDQRVNLRLTAVLSQDYSQRVGGTRVGGFLTTALANQQGELVVPLLVTGTMQQPRFAPDVQRVAEMRLKNLVPGLRNPQELTSRILGAVAGQQKEGEAPPRSTIGDIVGAITGRGQPPPSAPEPETPPQETEPQEAQPAAAAPPPPPPPSPPRGRVEELLKGLLGGRQPAEKAPEEEPPAR